MAEKNATENKIIKEQDDLSKIKQEYMQKFAQLTRQSLRDLTKSSNGTTVTFSSYDKDTILTYLKSPESNEKNLRNASIQMYQNSSHYRRLILYYALLPVWAYIISPLGYDSKKANVESYLKQYTKVLGIVEKMNIKHEMLKALITTFREGVLYGVIWSGSNSWFVQPINPDICQLSTIEDGTWLYSVDMSKIKEEDLESKYPPEFTTMYNTYKSTKVKRQEVPSDISFCLKADETINYPIPPWASVLPSIYDLELYKDLAEVATEIQNYKLINMTVPTKDGVPTLTFNEAIDYYNQLANNVPDYVGVGMSPMVLDSIDFNKSQAANTTDEISDATQRFWYGSGTSSLMFGDAANTSSSALTLSNKTDEAIVLAVIAQCERLLNRYLKSVSGSIKFKINILPITIFNQEKMIGYYKESSTLGLPTKMQYAAAVNATPSDILGMSFLENEVLKLTDSWIPLKTSYTQPGNEVGREPLSDEDIGNAGEATRANDGNDD